jgi:ferredoxin--NADP+ reductase
LHARVPELITWAGWEAIDAHESALGEPSGRPRVKLVRLPDLIRAGRI